jgi:ATP-dependent helicase/nuclease subunit A
VSAPGLTPRQRDAVERGAGDACVLAGAGSGKTTVLVARAARLVAHDRVDLRRLALLTYTDAAAASMKARLGRSLAAGSSPEAAARRLDVPFAPVSTFHAFCGRLLREHALDAGVDPGFAVLDDDASSRLLDEAFEAVDRRFRRAKDPALAALDLLGDGAPKALRLALRAVRSSGLDPATVSWRRGGPPLEAALATLGTARAAYEALAASPGVDRDAVRAVRDALARLASPHELGEAGFAAVRRALEGDGEGRMDATLPKAGLPAKAATAARGEVFEAYRGVARALLDEVGATLLEGPVRAWLASLDAEYARRKRDAGGLDFADLERAAVALLRRRREAGEGLEGLPERLLVDEFQDVNPVQAELLALLREPAGGRRVDVFAVGDPKQAIYGFRGSDESVMAREWERAGEAGRERLLETFRARPALVELHNALFGERMTAASVGVEYEPMVARAAFHEGPGVGDPPAAEVLLVDAGDEGDRVRLEAAAVAARVARWLRGEDGLRARKERDASGAWSKGPRPFRAGDVAILLRKWTNVKAYERALLAEGIPFHVGKGRGFYGTEEVRDLVNLLRVVHDPADDFAVAAWMTSPAVGATDEDLLEVFRGAEAGTAFERARARPRVAGAARSVDELRRLAARADLATTVRAALDAVDAVPCALLQDGGARRAGNLEKAVGVARRLDAEGRHGLSEVLRWLEEVRQRAVEEPEAPSGHERDSVALLTVHAAKGLEWPCVVLAEAHAGTSNKSDPLLVDRDGGFAARLFDPVEGWEHRPAGHAAIGDLRREANRREAERLLYVALTRAEERLVVSMSCAGATAKGGPAGLRGWAPSLWKRLGAPFEEGEHEVRVGGARVAVRVERPGGTAPASAGSLVATTGVEAVLSGGPGVPAVDSGLRTRAEVLWREARRPVETLGRMPFVATASDLLAFAKSPRTYYEERVLGGDAAASRRVAAEPDDPAWGAEAADAAEREERLDDEDGPVDRTALGRVVHRAIEIWDGSAAFDAALATACEEEHGDDIPASVPPAARAMLERFRSSEAGKATAAAIAAGTGARREVAFHARVAFPEKEAVDGYDSLLLKGTIDLWLEGKDGVRIVDHKTNAPSREHPTPQSLVERYAPQLRLYALALERLRGPRVAGASLLLLDPAWGGSVDVPVDVSGDGLHETRRLCRAFALALRRERWPERWDDLLAS